MMKQTPLSNTHDTENQRITHDCCIPSHTLPGDTAPANTRTTAATDRNNKTPPNLPLKELPGGWFYMGTNDPLYPQDGEAPRRSVFVSPFLISATTVSNADFAVFVSATGYKTSAEKIGRSFVFSTDTGDKLTTTTSSPVAYAPWWKDTEDACWHAPQGKDSSIADIPHHPVTHVSYTDALHYCDWTHTRLPTEAQWEYAARGEQIDCGFPWGDTLEPDDQHLCNVWQGQFPATNTADDGYTLTAPVNAFPPNSFGLYNMTGNVWEWVADRFTTNHPPRPVKNPAGPLNGDNYVTRGGSFLCHHSYCSRYHVFSRQSLSAHTSCANVGFRVAS